MRKRVRGMLQMTDRPEKPPVSQAIIHHGTGSVELHVPVALDGEYELVRLGITLNGVSSGLLTKDLRIARAVEKGLLEATSGVVEAKKSGKKLKREMPLFEAVADAVSTKIKDTM